MSITVNDLLDLMAWNDEVTITYDHTGEDIFEGYVGDVPDRIRVMKPCSLTPYRVSFGLDTAIQIGVDA